MANSTVKGGAGKHVDGNSRQFHGNYHRGQPGNDTLNISAVGDYEFTEIRLGAGNDTLNFSGNAVAFAEVYGGAGDDDINISQVSGWSSMVALVLTPWSGPVNTYDYAFGDSTESSLTRLDWRHHNW